MSEIRKDIFTGAFVLISEPRGLRPIPHEKKEYLDDASVCPFCPGNEELTPMGEAVIDSGWQVRFFPNKYPAMDEESVGMHEIFVDTPSHYDELKDFDVTHMETVFLALRDRKKLYSELEGVEYIQIFKNKGITAGASQRHSHWQIVAGRFVPLTQRILLERLLYKGRKCLYCKILEEELLKAKRIIIENERFAALAPYASRFCYEVWILPKRHVASFEEISREEMFFLAEIFVCIMKALDKIKENIDYNILVMDSPKTHNACFHWHIQILPRMGTLAGYELATGSYINHITPEKATERLKSAINGGK